MVISADGISLLGPSIITPLLACVRVGGGGVSGCVGVGVRVGVRVSVCPSVCPSVCLSVCFFVYLSKTKIYVRLRFVCPVRSPTHPLPPQNHRTTRREQRRRDDEGRVPPTTPEGAPPDPRGVFGGDGAAKGVLGVVD